MSAPTFFQYYYFAFIRPQRTLNQLAEDPRRLKFGILFITIPAVLYVLIYIFLHAGGGAPSVFTPWLNISKEDYYYYNQFLTAPSFYMSWLMAASVAQLTGKLFGSKSSFEDMLAVFGLGTSIAMWGTMLHDLIMSFLGAIGVISLAQHEIDMNSPTIWRSIIWACMFIYLVWFLLMFSKGVAAAQKIRKGPAILTGTISFIVFQAIFLIFNR